MSVKMTSDLWWKNAVFYCLDIETFYDLDGDGCGDLPGLTELGALGFDTIALHHVGQELDPFIDAFGEHVLPRLR